MYTKKIYKYLVILLNDGLILKNRVFSKVVQKLKLFNSIQKY